MILSLRWHQRRWPIVARRGYSSCDISRQRSDFPVDGSPRSSTSSSRCPPLARFWFSFPLAMRKKNARDIWTRDLCITYVIGRARAVYMCVSNVHAWLRVRDFVSSRTCACACVYVYVCVCRAIHMKFLSILSFRSPAFSEVAKEREKESKNYHKHYCQLCLFLALSFSLLSTVALIF